MRNAYIGVAIAIVAIAALLIFGDFGGDDDQASPPEPAPAAEPAAAVESVVPEPAAAAPPEEPPNDAAQAVDTPKVPSFDVVRIDSKGKAVIAGRAAPGAEVSVLSGDQLLGSTTADDRGEWVLLPDRRLSSGPSALSLAAKLPESPAVESESVVVVDVPEFIVTEATPVVQPAEVLTPSESAVTVAPRTGEALVVLVPRVDGGASTVLQGPEGAGVGVDGEALRLEAIDYDAAGNLVLSGRAEPGTDIRAFVDDAAVGVVEVAEGRWRLAPEDAVAPGQHALRIEQIGESGAVMAELSLPFSRAGPDELALDEGQVVVQPGNSLWRIARRAYGEGVRYAVIYDANRDQIGDPDLIFPGQIFALPEPQ